MCDEAVSGSSSASRSIFLPEPFLRDTGNEWHLQCWFRCEAHGFHSSDSAIQVGSAVDRASQFGPTSASQRGVCGDDMGEHHSGQLRK